MPQLYTCSASSSLVFRKQTSTPLLSTSKKKAQHLRFGLDTQKPKKTRYNFQQEVRRTAYEYEASLAMSSSSQKSLLTSERANERPRSAEEREIFGGFTSGEPLRGIQHANVRFVCDYQRLDRNKTQIQPKNKSI